MAGAGAAGVRGGRGVVDRGPPFERDLVTRDQVADQRFLLYAPCVCYGGQVAGSALRHGLGAWPFLVTPRMFMRAQQSGSSADSS